MGFSEQLKKARSNMNYTQQQVADLMGITKSTYCGYETGKRQPDVAKIKKLACILNTSGDVLLETGFEKEMSIKDEEKQVCQSYDLELLGEAYGYKIPSLNISLKKSDIDLIHKYHALDEHGRDIINTILDKELARCGETHGKENDINEADKAALELGSIKHILNSFEKNA